jgi:hypothetical protein
MGKPLNKYLVSQSGLATWYGPWCDCRELKEIGFTISWTAVAATAGTLSFEGTDDPAQAVAGAGGTNVVALANITAAGGTYPTVGTVAANCMVRFENPPIYIRVIYTRSAGGGAGQFSGFAHGRSI